MLLVLRSNSIGKCTFPFAGPPPALGPHLQVTSPFPGQADHVLSSLSLALGPHLEAPPPMPHPLTLGPFHKTPLVTWFLDA